jgi:hypothetical protein
MTLQELIKQAREEGKWLYSCYRDLWFSPDELEAENIRGRFWSSEVQYFKLRNPQEELVRLRFKSSRAKDKYDDFLGRLYK